MKTIIVAVAGFLLFSGPALGGEPSPSPLKTDIQKLSYAIGYDLGGYLKSLEEGFDLEVIQQGIDDGYAGRKGLMSPDEAADVQQKFAARQQEKQIRKTLELGQQNRAKADAFLKENGKKKGVKTTASGLQYKVVKEGQGKRPTTGDTVRVHYRGSLLDGTEFDSSYKRNEPVEFQVGQVIPGWAEALQLMKAGSTYELYIPPDLAYGDRGVPPVIEPGSLLIFTVELLDVTDGNTQEQSATETMKTN